MLFFRMGSKSNRNQFTQNIKKSSEERNWIDTRQDRTPLPDVAPLPRLTLCMSRFTPVFKPLSP